MADNWYIQIWRELVILYYTNERFVMLCDIIVQAPLKRNFLTLR